MAWSLQIPWLRWHGPLGASWCKFRTRGRPRQASPEAACWRRDPLSHPALQAMTQRELGDLPFDPRAVADD